MAEKLRIGWIGTGVMGLCMAGHLQALGLPLTVYNRTKAKADPLLAKGARWGGDPRAVAEASDVVFTMVSYPRDVESVILGETGVLPGLPRAAWSANMSTSSPVLAERIAAEAEKGLPEHGCPSYRRGRGRARRYALHLCGRRQARLPTSTALP